MMKNWNNLSMHDRANYIRVGVSSGITKLSDIHRAYNTYAKGGYLDWISKIKEWRPGISEDIDAEEPTYDYEGFFMEDPERAWRMLNDDQEVHFTDKYKKPNHPTFSDESIYSTPETPGGHWYENYGNSGRWVYEPSEYTKKNIEETRRYLEGSGEGYLDGLNAVFPQETIYPNKFDKGGPTYNKKKRRWYNAREEQLSVGHGYWSEGAKKYVMYGTDGSVTKYTPLEWAKKKNEDTRRRRKELERKYSIPANKRTTLTQSGNKDNTHDRGAKVSQQQVDSILKYAKLTNIQPYEALGLSAVESTFNLEGSDREIGNFYDKEVQDGWTSTREVNLQDKVSPVLMTSDWSYINDNPYNDFIATVEKEKDPKKREKRALEGRVYMEKQAKKYKVDIPPLQHALELYKSGRYNPGEKGYNDKVKRRGSNLRNSPEMVEMVNKSKFK